MYTRIAVPIDSSISSHHALPYAVRLAQQMGAALELVQIAYPPAAGTELYGAIVLDHAQVEALHEAAARHLADVAARVTRETGMAVGTTAVTDTGIPDALAEHVERSGTGLLVMTTHDRPRLERWLIGSVAESVARAVHIPVILVKGDDQPPSFDPLPSPTHMLVPLDGSPLAASVLPHVAALARATGARVTLLAVVEPLLATGTVATTSDSAGMLVTEDGTYLDAPTVLEAAARPLRDAGVAVDTLVGGHAHPARAIIAEAARMGADLIAMSTHGRGALGRLIAGSVATKVLHDAQVPVLLYRPAGVS